MTPFAKYIFAMLLEIVTPGQSTYSRVQLPACDETCQQTPLCDNPHDWKCKPPQFSQQLYDQNLRKLQSAGVTTDKAKIDAKLLSFTRPESYEEGLVRYAVIAQTIADVSDETTRHICKKTCDAQSDETHAACSSSENKTQCMSEADGSAKACHNQCTKDAPWLWSRSDLAFMAATVTNQESGYRADVHGGTGALGRGDCDWRFSDGRVATPFAKGASPVPGTCRSVCLGQINIGNGKTPGGWSANDLVGVDYQSTKRCITSVARTLARARTLCTRWNKAPTNWAKATFAAYGTGASCVAYQRKTVKKNGKPIVEYAYNVKKDDGKVGVEWGAFPPDNAINKNPLEAGWPAQRAGIFQRYQQKYNKKTLVISSDVQKLLEDPRIKSAINQLMISTTQVEWMSPLPPKPQQSSVLQAEKEALPGSMTAQNSQE